MSRGVCSACALAISWYTHIETFGEFHDCWVLSSSVMCCLCLDYMPENKDLPSKVHLNAYIIEVQGILPCMDRYGQ